MRWNGDDSAPVQFRLLLVSLIVALALSFLAGPLQAQTASIGGSIWQGARLPDGSPQYTGNTAIIDAQVMVQDMNGQGAFVSYGTLTGNRWSASVPVPGEYVAVVSAPGFEPTSRSFLVVDGGSLEQDAYLLSLPHPKASLLVYAFEDLAVNGEDDFPDDPPLSGVTFRLLDQQGQLVASGVSGGTGWAELPPYSEQNPLGSYYFTGLEPGEYIVEADPSTVPGWGGGWYHTSSEEGSQRWEISLYPGDPGTEEGEYLIWFGFVKALGQIPNAEVPIINPEAGSIEGYLLDAEGNDDEDALPPESRCISAQLRVPDGLTILFTAGDGIPPHPIATTEADPVTGYYRFDNVPPGRYRVFAFDVPIDYVWVPREVTVRPRAQLSDQNILLPRFFARTQGYVYDGSTRPPTPLAGVRVKFRLLPGNLWQETITDSSGWYNFDDLEEVEVLGFLEVDPPVGYQAMVAPGDQPVDPAAPSFAELCQEQLEKRGNRYVQFFSGLNYRADLFVEPIPADQGLISGFTFYDQLIPPAWLNDGLYDETEEPTVKGVIVELWNGDATLLLQSTSSGRFDAQALRDQGWVPTASTVPVTEFGGIYNGTLLGSYQFAGLAPGSYLVKVVPPAGYSASTPASVAVTVSASTPPAPGVRQQVDFGLSTLVPLAGSIEGGVYDDINIDANEASTFFMEKAIVVGVPVGVYDYYGYLLDVFWQPSPLCYESALDGSCDRPDLGLGPVTTRLLAPGSHLYVGNDPSQTGYNANYLPLALTYSFGQGMAKFEADWSLVPVAFTGMGGQLLSTGTIFPENRPVIDQVAPLTAAAAVVSRRGNRSFLISGRNFGERQGYATVSLGGVALPVKSWSDSEILIRIPAARRLFDLRRTLSPYAGGTLLVANSTGISTAVPLQLQQKHRWTRYLAQRSVYVDGSNQGTEDGSAGHPWRTIGSALEHLPAGTPRYVFVAPGLYQERLQIVESDIQIIGAGPLETIVDGLSPAFLTSQGIVGGGPVFFIGGGGKEGSVRNVMLSGLTITGGTIDDDIGAGIFGDYGNRQIDINNCVITRNGGYYGGGIWLHKSNHDVRIWSNLIAENGNPGGYGGAISVNDEPFYPDGWRTTEDHGEPEHIWDDHDPGPPPGTYHIFNNLIFHNFSPDYGGGISLYEITDRLLLYGNMVIENKADDHGGGAFFEDAGPIEIHDNVFLRNYSSDDGGAISFEDVGNDLSTIRIYNNLFAENIADDRGENHARGGALAFDDSFYGEIFHNTIVGNIVSGSRKPVGGAIDSERNGHEYIYLEPGFSDPKIYNNIIWDNWRLEYDQPREGGEEEDLNYTFGLNYRWTPDQLHVDNPDLQPEWESHGNSESFSFVRNNLIAGGYANGNGNINLDPRFVDPAALDWRLQPDSPILAPVAALAEFERPGMLGASMRIPTGILGAVVIPRR